jgi:hypothetical protein
MRTVIISEGDSVHSRNGVILGELIAAQYYGVCIQQQGFMAYRIRVLL